MRFWDFWKWKIIRAAPQAKIFWDNKSRVKFSDFGPPAQTLKDHCLCILSGFGVFEDFDILSLGPLFAWVAPVRFHENHKWEDPKFSEHPKTLKFIEDSQNYIQINTVSPYHQILTVTRASTSRYWLATTSPDPNFEWDSRNMIVRHPGWENFHQN